jgi:hypothetical protein
LNLFHNVGCFHSCLSCVGTGITHFRPGSLDRMFECLTGQHAKYGRHTAIVVDLSNTSHYLLTDIIVMAGLTSYDRAKTNHCDVFAALRQLLCSLCYFTGTRHPNYGYLFVTGAMTLETIYRSGKQFRGYEFVEPAHYNSVTALAGRYFAFYLFNHTFTSPNNSRG